MLLYFNVLLAFVNELVKVRRHLGARTSDLIVIGGEFG